MEIGLRLGMNRVLLLVIGVSRFRYVFRVSAVFADFTPTNLLILRR